MRRPFLTVAAAAAVTLSLPTPAAPPSAAVGTAGPSRPLPGPATSSSEVVPPVTPDVRVRTRVPTSLLDTVPESDVSSGEVTPAEAIRRCESDGIYTAENPVSSASGAYQFISSTWTAVTGLKPPASAYPREVQDAAFRELWDDGAGAHHWNPSRHCWAPLLVRAA